MKQKYKFYVSKCTDGKSALEEQQYSSNLERYFESDKEANDYARWIFGLQGCAFKDTENN